MSILHPTLVRADDNAVPTAAAPIRGFDPVAFRLVAILATCLALAYVMVVKPGTPSDEPSHFQMVQYYASHWKLPVLGDAEVSHEGQMGPVYYTLAAILYKVLAPHGETFAFYALRIFGVLLVPLYVFLTYRIVLRLFPTRPGLAKLIMLSVATNATVLAIASSLQNDMLTMVFAAWATDLLLEMTARPTISALRPVGLGAVVSLAILTKASALFLIPAAIACIALSAGPRKVKSLLLFIGTVAAFCAWWFARNYVLYGDISAQNGLRTHGYVNASPPVALWHLRELWQFIWTANAYYWVPTEYFRNLLHAPAWLKIAAILWTLCMLAGWLAVARSKNYEHADMPTLLNVFILTALCVLVYLASCTTTTNFAPRVMFTTHYAFATLVILGWCYAFRLIGIHSKWGAFSMTLAVTVLANGFAIWMATAIPALPFHMFRS